MIAEVEISADHNMVSEVECSAAPIKVHPQIDTPMSTQEILSHPDTHQVVICEELDCIFQGK